MIRIPGKFSPIVSFTVFTVSKITVKFNHMKIYVCPTHFIDKLVWLLVRVSVVGICGFYICLQTVSHICNIKVGMAHERSWPTARLDYASHRDCRYCAT